MRVKSKYPKCVLLACLAGAASCPIFAPAVAQKTTVAQETTVAEEVTAAEKTLFLDKHFSSTGEQTIDYHFHQEASNIAAFSDEATVEVHERHPDGTASVSIRFLSDEHAFPMQPIEHATGNPIILGFLESDIAKMKRLTGGSTNYFRKRIRLALASTNARNREISVHYKDRNVPAREITVFPYTEESQRQRLGRYAEKAYVFVVSTHVPGEVYCIFTVLNEKVDQAADSSIRIAGGDPKQCKSEH